MRRTTTSRAALGWAAAARGIAGSKWYNGTSNSSFAAGSNVVFAGTAGTVTFHCAAVGHEYAVQDDRLCDHWLVADAHCADDHDRRWRNGNDQFADLWQQRPHQERAGHAQFVVGHNYTGNTTINEGVLGIANASLGATAWFADAEYSDQ